MVDSKRGRGRGNMAAQWFGWAPRRGPGVGEALFKAGEFVQRGKEKEATTDIQMARLGFRRVEDEKPPKKPPKEKEFFQVKLPPYTGPIDYTGLKPEMELEPITVKARPEPSPEPDKARLRIGKRLFEYDPGLRPGKAVGIQERALQAVAMGIPLPGLSMAETKKLARAGLDIFELAAERARERRGGIKREELGGPGFGTQLLEALGLGRDRAVADESIPDRFERIEE